MSDEADLNHRPKDISNATTVLRSTNWAIVGYTKRELISVIIAERSTRL